MLQIYQRKSLFEDFWEDLQFLWAVILFLGYLLLLLLGEILVVSFGCFLIMLIGSLTVGLMNNKKTPFINPHGVIAAGIITFGITLATIQFESRFFVFIADSLGFQVQNSTSVIWFILIMHTLITAIFMFIIAGFSIPLFATRFHIPHCILYIAAYYGAWELYGYLVPAKVDFYIPWWTPYVEAALYLGASIAGTVLIPDDSKKTRLNS